jgi:lipopolysaccharide cholinephosphotransferase
MGTDKNAYILSPEELRALQMCLLDMLAEIDRICEKHGIKYGIDGGTLLGAVRHKGFIPWDDDLDIVMLRSDYNKLREACKTELDKTRFFFQDNTTDSNYRWGYGRIRRLDSEFVRCGQEHLKMKTGIFLDIFPRDNVPESYPLRLCHALSCFFWRKVLYSEVGKVHADNCLQRTVYKLLNKIPASAAFKAYNKISNRLNAKPSKYVRCYGFTIATKQRQIYAYPRKWFEELAPLEFEGKMFPACKNYDEYLTFVYGGYMQLPPPNQRRWHPCSKFSLPKGFEI